MTRTKSRRSVLIATLALAGAGLVCAPASADTWPGKPVRIMVGASPGGGTDLIARMLADKFASGLNAQFIVENRPGASNTIAADLTAKATADGTTLLVATNTGQAIAPHLLKLAFDPLKDLQPIGLIVSVPNVLVAGPALGTKNLQEIVQAMRQAPGSVRYASSGVGSTQHLAGEGFDLLAGTRSIHVPYKGSSQAHLDLIGGQLEMMFDTTSSAMAHIRSGKLATELQRVLALADVKTRLEGLGGTPGAMSPGDFARFNQAEFERFGKLIKDAKVTVGN